jgi:stage IV sporulation protein B
MYLFYLYGQNNIGDFMKKAIRVFDSFFAVVCAVIFSFVALGEYIVPDSIVNYDGSKAVFSSIYTYSDTQHTSSVDYQSAYPRQETLRLLGIVPVKDVTVTQKASPQVYVSGNAFGIKLYTDGVIVVGTQSVDLGDKKINPAEQAGIEVGDIIVAINGTNVYSSDDVQEILNDNNGKPYTIKVKRDERYRTFTLTPVYSEREGCYKAGMWVRDSTAGIGTITFFNPDTGTFGALGHQINDVDTNEIMPLLEGEAVEVDVTSVQKGTSGSTGSLICTFRDTTIGTLYENSTCGIYGTYSGISDDLPLYCVASKQEVKKGSAQIISTIDATGPQYFDIEITHISYSDNEKQKNMVIRVTDERLIEATGGIVQGMSGSPIIQNGKLVGAVTHVIVNNPQKGYAIFAQTMLEETTQS